jgi:hypothetical protein
MEAEGIAKFWKMKEKAKRASMTVLQKEARLSRRVSWFCGWVVALLIVILR